MRLLTVAEYANEQGISVAAVYKKIQKGKVKTTKGERNNQQCTMIIDDSQDLEIQPVLNQKEQNNPLQSDLVETSPEHYSNSYQYSIEQSNPLHTDNKELIQFMEKMTEYIELAGQARLLTDSEHHTKQCYFEVTAENKTLIQEKAELKAKLDITQERLKNLEEKLKQQEQSKLSSWLKKI